MEKKVIKLALLLGYECNNRCLFCYDGTGYKRGRVLPISTEEAKEKIKIGFEAGCNFLDILGGEPTIRKDLIDLINYAKRLGYEQIAITTNGQMLSYYDYAKKLVEAGLNHIIFSIHSNNPEIHDFLTSNKGSWERAINGLKNIMKLKDEGYEIYVGNNTVITKYNYDHMDKILEFLANLGINGQDFIFPHPRGRAYVYFDEIVPSLSEIFPYIRKTIGKYKKIKEKYKNIKHFAFRYVPLCYLYPDIGLSSEYKAIKLNFFEKHVGPEFEDWNVEEGRKLVGKRKSEACNLCILNQVCEGIWLEYAEERGLGELYPIYDEKELFRKIIEKKLPFVELIQILYKIKKYWLFGLNECIDDIVHNIAVKTGGFFVKKEDSRRNKKIYAFGYNINKINKLLDHHLRENQSIKDHIEIGKLLGYPQCCIKAHEKYLINRTKEGNDEYYMVFDILSNSKKNYWYLNFLYNFQTRISHQDEFKLYKIYMELNKKLINEINSLFLIPHIPHSFDCKKSLKIAYKTYKILLNLFPEFAKKLKEILSRPILYISKWEWYTLELENFEKKDDGSIKIKVRNIVEPYAPIKKMDLRNTEVIYREGKIFIDNQANRGILLIFEDIK